MFLEKIIFIIIKSKINGIGCEGILEVIGEKSIINNKNIIWYIIIKYNCIY